MSINGSIKWLVPPNFIDFHSLYSHRTYYLTYQRDRIQTITVKSVLDSEIFFYRYDDFDVPDTMNVHGVYDTSASMQTFYSRAEYQTFLQQQAGMAGSAFGFYGGVKKAWGSSSLSGSQKYMALYSIDIDR